MEIIGKMIEYQGLTLVNVIVYSVNANEGLFLIRQANKELQMDKKSMQSPILTKEKSTMKINKMH